MTVKEIVAQNRPGGCPVHEQYRPADQPSRWDDGRQCARCHNLHEYWKASHE